MEYKAFRIGALFEKLNAPYIGAGRKQDNVSKERTEEFSLPLINCKWGDNGIMYYPGTGKVGHSGCYTAQGQDYRRDKVRRWGVILSVDEMNGVVFYMS